MHDAIAARNRRILLIDDNRSIHEDFRKILAPDTAPDEALAASEAALFGGAAERAPAIRFDTESAYQGLDGVALAEKALGAHNPFAIAFVDVRMPPGIDGLETARRLWAVDPDLQIVICTAYSDYSWAEMQGAMTRPDQIVILKKPFDGIEALQLACALTEKWNLERESRRLVRGLEARVAERTRKLAEANAALAAQLVKSAALARASQNMMEDAVAARERVDAVNAGLEREVAHRTGELAAKNTELERAMRAKDMFLANMSHELRTPLNAILGFTGTLLMKLPGPLNPVQDEQLGIVQSSARHLLSLINDLLDVAKLDAGKMVLVPESFGCRAFVEDAIGSLRPLADQKHLALQLQLPKDEVRVTADRRALRQILLNLCGNAIKFTDAGSVTVTVAPADGAAGAQVEFSVADTGPGIRPDDQPRIFQAYAQMDSTHREGTGLGLHLSQKLAHLLHGEIAFRSDFGHGSRFWLTLPAA